MSSNSNSKKRKHKSLMKTTKQKYKTKRRPEVNIYNIFILNLIGLLLVIILLSYHTFKMNNDIKNILHIKQEQMNLESIAPHYIFLGDSITEQYELSRYFKGYSVVNSGVGGDTTEKVLEDLQTRVYQYNPSTVFLMIGTNDVKDNKSATHIFGNIKKIVQEIQINLPNTKIIVESIIPSQENWGEADKNDKRREINKLLYNEFKNSSVTYLDLYALLEDKNTHKLRNDYTNDGLHLNHKAYEIVSKQLKEYMIMKNK